MTDKPATSPQTDKSSTTSTVIDCRPDRNPVDIPAPLNFIKIAFDNLSSDPELPQDFISEAYEVMYRDVQLRSPTDGNLANGIHAIFARGNWVWENDAEPDGVWDAILPSLRLASKFLQESNVMGWWPHVLYGKPAIGKTKKRRYLKHTAEEEKPSAIDEVKKTLDKMAPRARFIFGTMKKRNKRIWGAFSSFLNYERTTCLKSQLQ